MTKQKNMPIIITAITMISWLISIPTFADTPFPQVDGDWWQISGVPDIGKYNRTNAAGELTHDPIDFCVWKADDGSWQEQACIRSLNPSQEVKRLLYRWSDNNITNLYWETNGVNMLPDTSVGETFGGGLTSPHVLKNDDGMYYMVYGGGAGICLAESSDGINFTRHTNEAGKSIIITASAYPPNDWPRDPCLMKYSNTYYCYYTVTGKQSPPVPGAVIGRWTTNIYDWSMSTNVIVSLGGIAGDNPWSAECPHAVYRFGKFYLFRSGQNSDTYIYCSTNPLYFGVNDDSLFLTNFAASYGSKLDGVEVIRYNSRDYFGALTGNPNGSKLAKLKWIATNGPPRNPSVYINDGAATVTVENVELTLYAEATEPVEMMIANNAAFTGSSWTNYSYYFPWMLGGSFNQENIVYVKYRDSDNMESETVTGTIFLLPEPMLFWILNFGFWICYRMKLKSKISIYNN